MLDIPSLPVGYTFHHLGYATTNIARERTLFEFLGYRQEGDIFSDAIQGITGCFMIGSGPRVELLEPLPGSQTLTPWLNAGIKIYHFAYWVNDIEQAIEWTRSQRAKVITQPKPSVAFDLRRICFVMFRNGLLIELIEKGKNYESC